MTYHQPQYDGVKSLLVGNERNLDKEDKKVEKRSHTSGQVGIIEENAHQEAETDHGDGVDGEVDENQCPVCVR